MSSDYSYHDHSTDLSDSTIGIFLSDGYIKILISNENNIVIPYDIKNELILILVPNITPSSSIVVII